MAKPASDGTEGLDGDRPSDGAASGKGKCQLTAVSIRPRSCLSRTATTRAFLPHSCNSRTVGSALSTSRDVPRQTGSLMVDDQAVLAFLQHLDLALSAALRGDEQQRLRRLTMIHALVMALLADPQELDQALRQAAARLAELDS
jgi:hypothetical protein